MEQSELEQVNAAQSPSEPKWTLRFKIGIVLLVANIPFGLAGLGLAGIMIGVSDRKTFWGLFGATVYGLSWAMLGLGVLLAGPQGVQYVKKLRQKWFGRRQD